LELSGLGQAWQYCVNAWFTLESQLKFGSIPKTKVFY
jgi:hypothetical protein